MLTELDMKLQEALQKIHRLSKIDSVLAELSRDEAELRHKVNELKEVVDKENLDVEKLDHTNIVSIFYSLTGKLEDKYNIALESIKNTNSIEEMAKVYLGMNYPTRKQTVFVDFTYGSDTPEENNIVAKDENLLVGLIDKVRSFIR
jgi:hypothetical protein